MTAAGPVLDLVADDRCGCLSVWRCGGFAPASRGREAPRGSCGRAYRTAQTGEGSGALRGAVLESAVGSGPERARGGAGGSEGTCAVCQGMRCICARRSIVLRRLLADIGVDTRKRSTIASLRIENGRLQTGSEALRKQLQEVESERDDLRSQIETLSRAQFGRKSEQGRKTRPDHKGKTGGKRGPRPGGETHGRTPRPELARKKEVHDPPPEALHCPCCGAPRVANGSHTSDLIEVAVKAHVRVIDRTRWRKTCQCSDTPRSRCRPHQCRACFREPCSVSVSGRGCCSSFASPTVPCGGSRRGLRRKACRSHRERFRTGWVGWWC